MDGMFEILRNVFKSFAQRKEDKTRRGTRSSECWSVTHSWIDENTHLTVLASNHLKSTNGRKLPVTLAGWDYGLNANGMKGAS